MKYFLFPDNDFETLAFLLGQSCFCVTYTSWSTPSFGMLLSKLSNSNTHVCTSSIRMISFFILQCELFTSCSVSNNASLVCPHGQGEWGGQPNVDRPGEGEEGVPKIPKFVRTSFMDDPLIDVNCSVLIDGISSPSKSVVGIDF